MIIIYGLGSMWPRPRPIPTHGPKSQVMPRWDLAVFCLFVHPQEAGEVDKWMQASTPASDRRMCRKLSVGTPASVQWQLCKQGRWSQVVQDPAPGCRFQLRTWAPSLLYLCNDIAVDLVWEIAATH